MKVYVIWYQFYEDAYIKAIYELEADADDECKLLNNTVPDEPFFEVQGFELK